MTARPLADAALAGSLHSFRPVEDPLRETDQTIATLQEQARSVDAARLPIGELQEKIGQLYLTYHRLAAFVLDFNKLLPPILRRHEAGHLPLPLPVLTRLNSLIRFKKENLLSKKKKNPDGLRPPDDCAADRSAARTPAASEPSGRLEKNYFIS